MLSAVKKFFEDNIRSTGTESPASSAHALHVATAALMIEVMRADYDVSEAERRTIAARLQAQLDLNAKEIETLIELAEREAREATDYFQFTSLINRELQPQQKIEVMESLWRVALADGQLDKYERHFLRKLGELLHLSQADFYAAKERARRSVESSA